MSIWAALFWGAFSSAALYIGEALAGPVGNRHKVMGLVMGFGAGTLLSAVAYELVPASSLSHGLGMGISFALGALVYYVGDRVIDGSGGEKRQAIESDDEGSGAAMFLGALLDGVPEAFILGTTISVGGAISVAFIVAIFVSNIPQGIAGTTSLQAAGYSNRRIFRMWTALTIATALTAALGYLVGNRTDLGGLYAQAFAAGALLTMLADSMMPEGFRYGGKSVGLVVVLGYMVAAALTILQ
ncbi:MAG TPA: hypothetical protein VH306_07230 [Gaiellaceae bacterium]